MLNRTGIVIACVSCLTILFSNIGSYNRVLIISCILLLPLIGYVLYPEIKGSEAVELYSEREIVDNNATSLTAGGRTTRWVEAIDYLFKQPLGGGVIKTGKKFWAHNFWLDVSLLAGILPFSALLGCTIINLRKNFKIFNCRRISTFFRSWLIILNIGFFLACSVEPVMDGYPKYAFLFFCFWGMTSSIYDKINTEKHRI